VITPLYFPGFSETESSSAKKDPSLLKVSLSCHVDLFMASLDGSQGHPVLFFPSYSERVRILRPAFSFSVLFPLNVFDGISFVLPGE